MSVKIERRVDAAIRPQTVQDEAAISDLMAACFGERRYQRSVRHLRHCAPEAGLCFVIEKDGVVVGSIRYWPISVAGSTQLLLGPLAIAPAFKGQGYGKALVAHSIEVAATMSYDFILISGEPDYYPRFGFEPTQEGQFIWPGFIERERLQIKWISLPIPAIQTGFSLAILPMVAQAV